MKNIMENIRIKNTIHFLEYGMISYIETIEQLLNLWKDGHITIDQFEKAVKIAVKANDKLKKMN